MYMYISQKAPTLVHLIGLSLISLMHFGASLHHHPGICISWCETKHIMVYACTSFHSKKYVVPDGGVELH
jgi:hypothetical protein